MTSEGPGMRRQKQEVREIGWRGLGGREYGEKLEKKGSEFSPGTAANTLSLPQVGFLTSMTMK